MAGIAATTFSVAMLAAVLLIGFGVKFAVKPDNRKNGWLMIVAGVVLLANVLIWTV